MASRENTLVVLARIPVVRRMWAAITFSSFGDWLGLLATSALAQQLTHDQSKLGQGAAISGVFLVRLSPDLLLGPIAAAAADKWDRRKTVIIGDTAAGLLYATIAFGYNLVWLYVAQFVIEGVGLFTQPAKQVIQTTIVPKRLLPTANQVSLFSVYGSVPVAAGVFALLSAGNRLIDHHAADRVHWAIVIALVLNTVSFFVSAGTVYLSRHLIHVVPGERERAQSIVALLREGVGFVSRQPLVKALYAGIIGAFAAGGLTAGVALLWVQTLSAGAAGYSIMFGTVFTGLALGILLGPRVLSGYTRSRVFALAIGGAGTTLVVMSLVRDFILADVFAALVGLFAGIAWIIGYTLIGQEVAERLRGRVFAFVLSSVRITLFLTIGVGPLLAGALGDHSIKIVDHTRLRFSGPGLTLLIGGVLALAVGWYALRRATPTSTRVRDLLRRRLLREAGRSAPAHAGLFVAVDGIDPGATGTCALDVARALRELGARVTVTGEPADSALGDRVRELLADGIEAETAALLSAAERTEHVATVIRPALLRGDAVVCDRYVLSAMAMYGRRRGADVDGVRAVDALRAVDDWGTAGLRPDLTVVLRGSGADDDPAQVVLREEAEADPDRHAMMDRPEVDDALRARLRKLIDNRGLGADAPERAPS